MISILNNFLRHLKQSAQTEQNQNGAVSYFMGMRCGREVHDSTTRFSFLSYLKRSPQTEQNQNGAVSHVVGISCGREVNGSTARSTWPAQTEQNQIHVLSGANNPSHAMDINDEQEVNSPNGSTEQNHISVVSGATNVVLDIIDEEHDQDHVPNGASTAISNMLSPVVILFREQELGKSMLSIAIPVTAGLLTLHDNHSKDQLVLSLVQVTLCLGFAALWNGLLLRQTRPWLANSLEQLGMAMILGAFFGLISSHVQQSLLWVPWLCWVFSLLPFGISFFQCPSRTRVSLETTMGRSPL